MTPRAAIIAGFATILGLAVVAEWYARRAGSSVRPLSETLAAALPARIKVASAERFGLPGGIPRWHRTTRERGSHR
jgi:hypothetical protein